MEIFQITPTVAPEEISDVQIPFVSLRASVRLICLIDRELYI